MKNFRQKGSVTVEAVIILPFYLLTMIFLLNFLDIFYVRLAVQQGLNNASSTLSQYCYAVDKVVGIEKLTLSEETSDKAKALADAVTEFSDSTKSAMGIFNEPLSLDIIPKAMEKGKAFVNAGGNLVDALKSVKGEDVVNYLMTSAVETGGGMLVEAMVDDYLDQLKINRNLLPDGIHYNLFVDGNGGRYDLVLQAEYVYDSPMFSVFFDGFRVRQQVVAHPWIGGSTPGLR